MSTPQLRSSVHGWLILDKPLGLTSTQALGRGRRLLGGKKAGHGGTLDPLATGLLPLAFGEATKLIPYVMDGEKEYEFTVSWGESRTTDDAEGTVTAKSDVRPTEAAIRNLLPEFMGVIQQHPPSFSAIKVHGERAYDLARAGEVVELASRDVTIRQLTLMDVDHDSATFRVSCGKGMYVRSLARDLAIRLGTYAYVRQLRRTKVGPFSIEMAVSLPQLESWGLEKASVRALLPLKSALGAVPTLMLTPQEAHILRLGQKMIIRPQHAPFIEAPLIFAEHEGLPIALVEARAGEFRVLRGFHF